MNQTIINEREWSSATSVNQLFNAFAVTTKGVESVTASELQALGAQNIQAQVGGVSFDCDLRTLYLANLWLRTSSRVLIQLRSFSAKTTEMLYDQVRRMHWEDWLTPEMTFSVTAVFSGESRAEQREQAQERDRKKNQSSRFQERPARVFGKSALNNSHYAALKIKDSIVDRLRLKYGARPSIDTVDPDLHFHAYFRDGKCTLSLDSSGKSLHERGYRSRQNEAPMKETLAAAIVALSNWDTSVPFLDPMCGSGTLVLEAAMKALNIAPGLYRSHFGFQSWKNYDAHLFEKLREEALAVRKFKLSAPIRGYDNDKRAIHIALENAQSAGISKYVHFEKREFNDLKVESFFQKPGTPEDASKGTLLLNPPYGERLGEDSELAPVYKKMGDTFKQQFKGWNCFVFTGNGNLAKNIGLRTSKRVILFNGPIECRLLEYKMY